MPTDADAQLFERLDRIDSGLAETRVSLYADRDAQRATEAALSQKITTAKKAVRWAMAAVSIALLASFIAVVVALRLKAVSDERASDAEQAAKERVNQLVVNCLNSNAARVDREKRDEELGGIVYDSLGEVVPAPASPEAAAARQQLLDKAKSTFADKARASLPASLQPRDCSVEAVTNPSLVGPAKAN